MEPIMGEIKLFAGDFAPRGWMLCNGQMLNVNQFSTLFTILQNYYGGDGITTFALPDLRGRVAVSPGQGQSKYHAGQTGGYETNQLTQQQLPPHSHNVNVNTEAPDAGTGDNAFLSFNADPTTGTPINIFATKVTTDKKLNAGTISLTGNGQAVNNMQPFVAINYIIAIDGIYPSRP